MSNKSFEEKSIKLSALDLDYSEISSWFSGVNTMTKNVLQKILLGSVNEGKQFRSFVHVADVARKLFF